MAKVLLHVTAETTGDQLRMNDGFELVAVLDVRRVGAERLWNLVVSREVPEEAADE